MVLLSFRAGLRAKEIAKLTWSMVTDTTGEVADAISLHNRASKGRDGGRTIPLHRELADALLGLKAVRGERVRPDRPVIYSERAPGYSPNAVAIWFHTRYREIGLEGASSHSGRRTFITAVAKKITDAGWIAPRRPGNGWTFLAFDDPAIHPRRQCGKTKRYQAHLMVKPRRRTVAAPKSCNLARGDRELV
jgi:integrase